MSQYFPFKINGIPLDGSGTLPALKYQGASYSRQAVDSSSTGRNQSGTMIRDMITSKDKWQLEFVPCTQTQLYNLLTEIDDASFEFTYPNPMASSGTTTKDFYVGDRSAPVWKIEHNENSGRDVELWGNVTFNVIEL